VIAVSAAGSSLGALIAFHEVNENAAEAPRVEKADLGPA
jgi:hypothetical protein